MDQLTVNTLSAAIGAAAAVLARELLKNAESSEDLRKWAGSVLVFGAQSGLDLCKAQLAKFTAGGFGPVSAG